MKVIYEAVVCGNKLNAKRKCNEDFDTFKLKGYKHLKKISSTNVIEQEFGDEHKVITMYISLKQNIDGYNFSRISVDSSAIFPESHGQLFSLIDKLMSGQLLYAEI